MSMLMVAGIKRTRGVSLYRPSIFPPFILIIFIAHLFAFSQLSWADYSYVEILPPGWLEAEASDINDKGTVVGSGIDGDNNMRGFIYSRGTYKTLIPPDWERSFVQGINNRDEVVGHGLEQRFKGFLYSKGHYTEIIPEGWLEAYAYEINDSGVVVGYGRESSINKGFFYSKGAYTELLPPRWKEAYAYGINNHNVIAGYGRDENKDLKGFLYDKGNYEILAPPGWTEAKAIDINDSGDVVGHGRDNIFKGFMYSRGKYREIVPPGLIFVEIYNINNKGVFAGRGLYKNGRMAGFIYDGLSYRTLLPSGWKWSQAYAVNESGVVIGSGAFISDNRGFIASGLPDIGVNPVIIFFSGNVKKGLKDMSITVRNNGSSALNIGKIAGPEPPFSIASDTCSGKTLGLAATCVVTYSAAPASGPAKASSSEIPSNDPDENPLIITLGIYPDNDGDGYTLGADCDDGDPQVNPGMNEIPDNHKDDDCNQATGDN